MEKCNGTGLVLKICETKNNVWKKHELSILNGVDNYIKITKIKLDSAIKRFDSFEFTNPEILKLPLEDIYRGGNSKSRNPYMQTMLRLVGFGDNAGSGFPTILDVWKSEGWIKPELIEDTNLNQVTLVMKMEKESDDKSAEKSADLKNREGMALSERHQQILAIMEAGVEYSTEQVAEKIGLKGPRTRQLLNELVNKELLACIGTTKRRRYIKPVDKKISVLLLLNMKC